MALDCRSAMASNVYLPPLLVPISRPSRILADLGLASARGGPERAYQVHHERLTD